MTDVKLRAERRPTVVDRARSEEAEKRMLIRTYNGSTGLTWLWSILFGPLYFWVHGFVGRGFLLLGLCIVTMGFGIIAAPFLAYAGWKKQARLKAEDLVAISNARTGW